MPILLILRPASNTINFPLNTIAQIAKKHYSNTRLLFLRSQIGSIMLKKMDPPSWFPFTSKTLILDKSKSSQFKKHTYFPMISLCYILLCWRCSNCSTQSNATAKRSQAMHRFIKKKKNIPSHLQSVSLQWICQKFCRLGFGMTASSF